MPEAARVVAMPPVSTSGLFFASVVLGLPVRDERLTVKQARGQEHSNRRQSPHDQAGIASDNRGRRRVFGRGRSRGRPGSCRDSRAAAPERISTVPVFSFAFRASKAALHSAIELCDILLSFIYPECIYWRFICVSCCCWYFIFPCRGHSYK